MLTDIPYNLKFLWISWVGARPQKFLSQNFEFITDAMCGWQLDHKNFIREKLLLSIIWQGHEIFTFRLYGR